MASSAAQPLSSCAPTKNVHRTQFQRLQLLRFPRPKLQETNEARYWKKFKLSVAHKLDFLVNNVDVSPAKPHDIIATSGPKVCIYDARTHRLKRTITKFATTANCGVYRGDGKLIAAGSDKVVKIFQAEHSGPALRVFKGHADEVSAVGFSTDKVRVLSGSHDKTARFWDMASGECVRTFRGHADYVKSLTAHPTNNDLWLTSAYDHKVKLWDVRAHHGGGSGGGAAEGGDGGGGGKGQKASLTIDHGEPVEKIVVLPGGNIVLSAGGNVVKAWDLLTGGQLLHSFSNHQKTVTSLAVDGTGSRLLSGGLDGHIKIHDLTTYRICHALKYQDGISALAFSPDNAHFVVGLVTGILSIRKMEIHEASGGAAHAYSYETGHGESLIRVSKRPPPAPHGGTRRFFNRGQGSKAADGDISAGGSGGGKAKRPRKLQPYDRALRKFDYTTALDEALATHDPVVVMSVLEELRHREGGLQVALRDRTEEEMEPVLRFLVKYTTVPQYAASLIKVCKLVCDLYGHRLGRSVKIDELYVALHKRLAEEIDFQDDLQKLQGTLDMLIRSSVGTNSTEGSVTQRMRLLK